MLQKKNKILFINAATLRMGGGKSVAINFLKTLGENYKDEKFIAVVPALDDYRKIKYENIKLYFVPVYFHNPVFRIFLDYWVIDKLEKSGAKKVFNMGNIALPTNKYRQITLFHFPYAIYPESKIWKKLGLKSLIVHKLMVLLFAKRIKYSEYFLAQTQTAKKRLMKYYHLNADKIFIAPNAISLNNFKGEIVPDDYIRNMTFVENTYKCLCLSVYYVHKNIEVLIDVAELIKKNNEKIQIFLTITEKDNPNVKQILNTIKAKRLESILVNLGRVPMEKIGYLYSRIDALLLPTILESFTGTYVESMFFKKKILTSDMDFAREICKNNTWFFDPEDPEDILNKIVESKNSNFTKAADQAFKDVLKMKDWNQTTDIIINTINKI